MTYILDGVDCSSYLASHGYDTWYNEISGQNASYMLDGSYIKDTLARKIVSSAVTRALSPAQMSTLLDICSKDYITATFFDAKTNTYVTKEVIPQISKSTEGIRRAGEVVWWEKVTITLTER